MPDPLRKTLTWDRGNEVAELARAAVATSLAAGTGAAYNLLVNETHLQYLASDQWAETLKAELLPWVERVGDLGEDVLEIGPGPGRTTDLLRDRAKHVTAVEMDEHLARDLGARLAGTNVEVVTDDGTKTGLDSGRFSTVTAFSVLHHMPSPMAQDRLFAELSRVLRPGGVFVGTDSRDTEMIRLGHTDDTFVPVDPETLPHRLQAAGFTNVEIDMTEFHIRFVARKPAGAPQTQVPWSSDKTDIGHHGHGAVPGP